MATLPTPHCPHTTVAHHSNKNPVVASLPVQHPLCTGACQQMDSDKFWRRREWRLAFAGLGTSTR